MSADLKKNLERRAAFIQSTLRSGKLGGQELDKLLMEAGWRETFYAAIKTAVPYTLAGLGAEHTYFSTPALPFTDITDEPTTFWNPRQLLSQYIIARLDLKNPPDFQNEKEIVKLHAKIYQIFDAFGLELLAGRQLRGRSAGESLLESLEVTTRDEPPPPTARSVAERVGRLSAFQELYRILSTTAEQGRRTILLRLVGDVDGIVALLADVTKHDSLPGLQWLARLWALLDQHEPKLEAETKKHEHKKQPQPSASDIPRMTRDPLDWLFDFDLLGQIAEAAERAEDVIRGQLPESDSDYRPMIRSALMPDELRERKLWKEVEPSRRPVGAKKDDEAAETLMQNQRRLVADATQMLTDAVEKLLDAARKRAHPTDPTDKRAGQTEKRVDPHEVLADRAAILGDRVCAENLAEEIWWASFDVGKHWKAERVTEFCLGRERATWLTRGDLDPKTRRVRLAQMPAVPKTGGSGKNAERAPPPPPKASEHGVKPRDHGDKVSEHSVKPRDPSDSERRDDAPSVVIFGAGVAGLTAAHELAERGIGVTVVDVAVPPHDLSGVPPNVPAMPSNIGGMARTQWTTGIGWPRLHGSVANAKDEPEKLPGEHGYRLFPSFYRHLFDTMKRTPILDVPENLGIRSTAFDQLQATHKQVFARRGQFVPLGRERPRSLEAFRTEYMSLHEGLGFPKRDMARFFFKLLRYLMTCSERRAKEYETKSLMTFFDPSLYSEGFLKAIQAAPQALVAMDAELCDARTQGNVYIQLLLDQILGSEYTDSTLRGPTSVAWFAHWYHYLTSLNVKFINAELLALKPGRDGTATRPATSFDVVFRTAPAPHDIELEGRIAAARYIVVALDAVSAERVTRTWESAGVPFELRGYASHVTENLRARLARYDVVITFKRSLSRSEAEGVMHRLLDRMGAAKDDPTRRPRERSAFRNLYRATGQVPIPPGDVDEIKIVLWFEHAAGNAELRAIERVLARLLRCDGSEEVRLLSDDPTWVNTPTTTTTPRMPDDMFGEHATDRFQTFIGVQYYFEHDFKLVRGHVYLPDTEWGLSAVSQGQFWPRSSTRPPRGIRGVLSIDIGNCRQKSSYKHRTVMECTREEIAVEVWRQFTDSMRATRGPTSIVTSLPLPEPKYYHVDDNLVFTCDEGALRSNRTPFLVNNACDWQRRPQCQPWVPGRPIVLDAPRTDATDVWQAPHGGYRVHANRVVFCGTYMRTFTRMTTMEAANESARHAVNAILDHMAAHRRESDHHPIAGDYCDIWDPEEHELEDLDFFKRIDKLLHAANKPHIADILQFDKIADLQFPDPSPIQALMAALGSTIKSDWGMTSTEVVTSLDGLLKSAKSVVGGIAGAATDHPLLKLLGALGIGKGQPPNKGS